MSTREQATTEILPTHTPELFQAAVRRAAELLRAGEVVALPTETVYGLAANGLDAAAVARIYEVKGRPANNPIILHVTGADMTVRCVANWPTMADKLAGAFWPGPLTMVLSRAREIPDIVTAGGNTVGVRWPSHPLIQAVIRECGFPLAAPSANLSNRVSPTNAEHVKAQLGGRIPLIVDGGQSQVGIESTVLDLTTRPPRILRPGMVHAESLAAVIGDVSTGGAGAEKDQVLRSPGQLDQHYAPRARMAVLAWRDEAGLRARISEFGVAPDKTHIIAYNRIPGGEGCGRVSVVPHDVEAYARALYGELHRCDAAGAGLIVVEAPPEAVEWRAVADRLRRAATKCL